MANGVIAISGFDYQATIILAELFDHFEAHGSQATVRPEGKDDLDLHWLEGVEPRSRHIQGYGDSALNCQLVVTGEPFRPKKQHAGLAEFFD
jgi:hypothetical protein